MSNRLLSILLVSLLAFLIHVDVSYAEQNSESYVSDRELLLLSDLVYINLEEYENTTVDKIVNSYNPELYGRKEEGNLPNIESMNEWVLLKYTNSRLPILGSQIGLSAGAFKNKYTNEIVIAFKGSEEGVDWVYDILGQVIKDGSFQFSPARNFVNEIANNEENKNLKFILTGHSLGGYLTQKMALDIIEKDKKVSPNINFEKGVTFNGNGFILPPDIIDLDNNYITISQYNKAENGEYDSYVTNYGLTGDLLVFRSGLVHIGKKEFFDYTPNYNPFVSHPINAFYEHIPDIKITGRIVDETGHPVPDAEVIIKHGTNYLKKVKTNSNGYYEAHNLKRDLINLIVNVQANDYEEKEHTIKHVLSDSFNLDLEIEGNWVAYLKKAQKTFNEGYYENALDLIDKSIEKKSTYENQLFKAEILLNLGLAEKDNSRIEDALNAVQQSIGFNESSESVLLKGQILYHLGRCDEALDAFNKTLTMENNDNEYIAALAYIKDIEESGCKKVSDDKESIWEPKKDVDSYHDWTIKFNDILDESTVNSNQIFVMYNKEYVHGTQVILNDDKKSVTLKAPAEGYLEGETYTLYVTNKIRSNKNRELNQSVQMQFSIKENVNGGDPRLILSSSRGIATTSIKVKGVGFPKGHWSLGPSTVYFDSNNNGKYDFYESQVKVKLDENGQFETQLTIGLVKPGNYQIGYESDPLGCYYCDENNPAIWQPHNIFIQQPFEVVGKEKLTLSFDRDNKQIIVKGENIPQQPLATSGTVYIDSNKNGKYDYGDAEVKVKPDSNLTFIAKLNIVNIPSGEFWIGYQGDVTSITEKIDTGSPSLKLSTISASVGSQITVTAENIANTTFSSERGYFYLDLNGNRKLDAGEPRQSVYANKNWTIQKVLNISNNIKPGQYEVGFTSAEMSSYYGGVWRNHNINIFTPLTVTSEGEK